MIGTDGAIIFQPRPAGGPLPAMLASLEAEFVVEWQVADLGPSEAPAPRAVSPT